MFFVTAVVRDALDDDLGIVTAGEGALGVSPIVLGLAFVVRGAPSARVLGSHLNVGVFRASLREL